MMMSTKHFLSFLVVLTVVGLGIGTVVLSKRKQQESEREVPPARNQVSWYAEKSKAKGRTNVSLAVPPVEYGGSSFETDTDAALSYYSVVIARPEAEKVTVDEAGNSIVTWYKFKIIETLNQKDKPACPECISTPPQELTPVGPDEFLASRLGGELVVNGVTVSMKNPAFPPLEAGQNYLLYISKYPNGVADIGAGPDGVFRISDSGKIEPINRKAHPLKRDVLTRFRSSLSDLRSHIKNKKSLRP